MKVSWRSLSELLDLSGVSPEEAAYLLSLRTAPVEGVERVGDLPGVVTARVLRVEPHPGADRLRLCTVDRGAPAPPLRVVCGAPNVAEGQAVCFAPVGTTLPGGLTLEKRKIRGVESEGMILAEDELGIGASHEGIVVLPEGTAPGRPAAEALGLSDAALDLDNTGITNRPDLWGAVGIARELGAHLGRAPRPPSVARAEAAVAQAGGPAFPVVVEDAADCRRYVALVVEGLHNGPSPAPLRRRLETVGLRSVDLLVDLTQAVMLEQGQPLHAFDLRRVEREVRVRRAREGERLTTLDGADRALSPEDLVIADAARPLALAGVMGGQASGVTADTTAILLESACFEPVRVRRTAGRHGLRTDASTRFEKALDPVGAWTAALRFLELLLEHVPGARVSRAPTDAFPRPVRPIAIHLDYAFVRRRLGFEVTDDEIGQRLYSIGFTVVRAGTGGTVTVPSWRATKDVSVPEDLVEEVGRLVGYQRVVPAPALAPMEPVGVPEERRLERDGRAFLCLGAGYAEIASYAFYGPKECERTRLDPEAHVRLANPLSAEQDRLQTTCVPNLLRAAARNRPATPSMRLCEWTRVFPPTGPVTAGSSREIPVLGALRVEPADAKPGATFLSLKEDVLGLLDRLGMEGLEVRDAEGATLHGGLPPPPFLHPGRRAAVLAGGEVLAVVGEVHPAVARAWDLGGAVVAAAEANLARVLARARRGAAYRPVPRFPDVPFDVSLIVPRRTAAATVAATIAGAAPGAVRDVALFDVYEGAGIPEGHRSLAFTMRFADERGTLAPKAIERLQGRVLDVLRRAGWTVRTADAAPPSP